VRWIFGSYQHERATPDLSWSGTNAAGTPPKYSTMQTWLPMNSGLRCVMVASANV
jgi:hypothetical protein